MSSKISEERGNASSCAIGVVHGKFEDGKEYFLLFALCVCVGSDELCECADMPLRLSVALRMLGGS